MAKFEKGHPGGPGRPKGSRNKLGEDFISALAADFDEHGEETIATVRTEDPAAYLRVIAAIVPKELHVKTDAFDGLSDEDIAAILAIARAAIASHQSGRADVIDTAH